MCPSISGIPAKDAALSCELGARAVSLAVGSLDFSGFDCGVDLGDGSCGGVLRAGGNLVVKLLESDDTRGEHRTALLSTGLQVFKHLSGWTVFIALTCCWVVSEFAKLCKPLFEKMSWTRPKATRSSSREIYLVCQGFR